ncbi:MAG: hypothetical protein BGO90_14435 [Legionella sp. 40-6]|nr:biotin/lipoyl-binding protein [Legionella sp.]OJY52384.1 MAG: hypothetical protein BGO90_14435 [Legionella sp. 40-6]
MKPSLTLLFFFLISGFLSSCDRHQPPQFNGYIEADNIYLASPFYGVLQHLAVVRGQEVKKGQLLVHLNPDPQALALMQSAAELKQAQSMFADMIKPKRPPEIDAIKAQIAQTESRIRLAELRADRYNKLFRRNATDKDSMDAADTNLQQEEDAKAQYEANLMLAQL